MLLMTSLGRAFYILSPLLARDTPAVTGKKNAQMRRASGRKSSLSCRRREGIGSGTVCEERVGRPSPCVLNMPRPNF
nr:hypothetical protein EUX21_03870 [synthetic Caulobacter sp. 'ethensis']